MRANFKSIESVLMLKQLKWAGHVSRMDASRLPKVIFCGELKQGKRDRGAPQDWLQGPGEAKAVIDENRPFRVGSVGCRQSTIESYNKGGRMAV